MPVNLSPEQTVLVAVVVLLLIAVLLAVALLEVLVTRGAAFALRVSGHRPPRKSPARIALDELEERLRRRADQ